MVTISKSLAGVLISAIAIGTAAFGAHATQASAPLIFKAARGVSLDVGSKKIVGYYLSKDGICDATLMFGERPDADGHVGTDVTRMNVPVKAGAHARVYTSEGKAIELSCGTSAKLMTLRTLDMTALVSKPF